MLVGFVSPVLLPGWAGAREVWNSIKPVQIPYSCWCFHLVPHWQAEAVWIIKPSRSEEMFFFWSNQHLMNLSASRDDGDPTSQVWASACCLEPLRGFNVKNHCLPWFHQTPVDPALLRLQRYMAGFYEACWWAVGLRSLKSHSNQVWSRPQQLRCAPPSPLSDGGLDFSKREPKLFSTAALLDWSNADEEHCGVFKALH